MPNATTANDPLTFVPAKYQQAVRDWVDALRATGTERRGVQDLLDEHGNLRTSVDGWLLQVARGEVRQGRSALRQLRKRDGYALGFPVEYCCMGVACQISNLGEWGYKTPVSTRFAYVVGSEAIAELPADDNALYSTQLMPDDVRQEYGLRTPRGDFVVVPEWLDALEQVSYAAACAVKNALRYEPTVDAMLSTSLSTLNDLGLSFSDIASIIESNPPGLFEH